MEACRPHAPFYHFLFAFLFLKSVATLPWMTAISLGVFIQAVIFLCFNLDIWLNGVYQPGIGPTTFTFLPFPKSKPMCYACKFYLFYYINILFFFMPSKLIAYHLDWFIVLECLRRIHCTGIFTWHTQKDMDMWRTRNHG